MPVEAVLDHPKMIGAKSVFYGCVMRLLHHYWKTECDELPTETRELESIGHFTEHLWRQHGEDIMRVVRDVIPSLDHYYAVRVQQLQHLKDNAMTGVGVRRAKAAQVERDEAKTRMGQTGPLIPRKNAKPVTPVAPVIRQAKNQRPVRTD